MARSRPPNPGGASAPTSLSNPGGGTTTLPSAPYGGPSAGRISVGKGVTLVGVGTQLSGVTPSIWGFAQCGSSCDAISI